MIDIDSERLLTLDEATAYVAEKIRRPISRRTIEAWAHKGRDGVRLETIRMGVLAMTSAEALCRFVNGEVATPAPTPAAVPAARRREIERVNREADRLFGPRRVR